MTRPRAQNMYRHTAPERLKSMLVSPHLTIKETLQHMDRFGHRTIFVADKQNKLLGAVADGDMRRWILKDGNFNKPITLLMNKKPIAFPEGTSAQAVKMKMLAKEITCIPVVRNGGVVTGIYLWADFFETESAALEKLGLPVVIMAGGEGKRLGPLTRVLPKPLLPIAGKPMLEHILGRFRLFGCSPFYISLNYKSSLVKAYLSDNSPGDTIRYIEEKKPLGTVGALSLLKDKLRSTFFLTNCDIMVEADYADILKFHRQSGHKITLVAAMKNYTVPYGICKISKGGRLEEIQEKPEYDLLANTGMYVMEPEVIRDIPANTLFHMTDLLKRYLEKGVKVGAYPVSGKLWFDIGQADGLLGNVDGFGTAR